MTSPAGSLDGRVAIVTGASRGIGREIALELARRGAKVSAMARSESDLKALVGEIEGFGGKAIPVTVDVADGDAIQAAVVRTVEELGGLDILVNNAGMTKDGLLMRMSDQDWDDVLTVDLRSVFQFCRVAARHLRKSPNGRIVNISSIVGIIGNAGQANYSAAKAGVFGLTRSMAKELGGRGITVNAVAPGFIETDMTSGLPDGIRENSLKSIPAKRFGAVQDIAGTVAFLCEDAASYITGVTLPVDGGMSLGSVG